MSEEVRTLPGCLVLEESIDPRQWREETLGGGPMERQRQSCCPSLHQVPAEIWRGGRAHQAPLICPSHLVPLGSLGFLLLCLQWQQLLGRTLSPGPQYCAKLLFIWRKQGQLHFLKRLLGAAFTCEAEIGASRQLTTGSWDSECWGVTSRAGAQQGAFVSVNT